MLQRGILKKRARGYTLLELMLVVAIVGILATLSVGYSGRFMAQQGLRAAASGLVSVLLQARSAAISNNQRVAVTFQGGVFYAFLDNNGNSQYDTGETIYYRYPQPSDVPNTISAAIRVSSTQLTNGNYNGAVTAFIDATGFSVNNLTPVAWQPATICLKDTESVESRAVFLTVTATTRVLIGAAASKLCP